MRRLFSIVSLLMVALCVGAASTGGALLQRCAAKIKSAPSLSVTYTVSADGNTAEGLLVLQGEMFTISTPGMVSWYDGKSQWTYSDQIGEVNVISPTAEEVQQINPFAIVKSFSSSYSSEQVKSSSAGMTTLRLTANNRKSDISSADVTINDKTLYPTRIVLTMSNRQKVTINIKNVKAGGKLPVSNFRFDAKRYPNVQVIDLR
ncbi:outer membrane lipoprotein carrier protein LolA [Duncaniella freteri]|uniref:LolA family protein n=1 Tax=Duncaniella freteri TaxID=2530391 RepID=UPI0013700490|nr:outer membrane lipoprotein carrier protein LolA [Duncaniella freteri]NBJ08717.1 outer membrane lipoprotein carrier protein LolA [Alistipes sp. Z76]NCE70717.1 outer membrane lipoprotein carrier protein LolA [Muribaculaceae bacterium M3]